jgi:glycosyltransferase involved in cell wall biosynthesis
MAKKKFCVNGRGGGPRVLLVCDWFLKYATEQAIGLTEAGAHVFLLTRDHFQEFSGNRSEWEAVIQRARANGVRVEVIQGRVRSASATLDCLRAARAVRRFGPTVVHSHPHHDPWLTLSTRTSKAPRILTVHDPTPHPGQPRLAAVKRWTAGRLLAEASLLIVHGERLKHELQPKAGGRLIAVIPHGLTPAPTPNSIPPGRSILFFGRLEPYKGLDVLIAAADEMWSRGVEFDLVIAGRGPAADSIPQRPRLRAVLRYVAETEVDQLFANARLFVAPYTEASQSGVLSQAVGFGVPAIVSDVGDLPDLVVEPGQVVVPGDATALADRCEQYLDHGPELRAATHALATERLSWTVAGRETVAAYRLLPTRGSI